MSKLFKKTPPLPSEEIREQNTRIIIRQRSDNIIKKTIPPQPIINEEPLSLVQLQNNQLRIGFWSTWKVSCGIAAYAEHLYNAANKAGATVFGYTHNIPLNELLTQIDLDKIHILSIQYEPSIMPPTSNLISFIQQIRRRRIKVIMTFHSESAAIPQLIQVIDAAIYHKLPTQLSINDPKVNILPMAVPVFKPPTSRKKIRTKYGFDASDKIVTTTGFMFTWKQHADILNRLVPYLKEDPHLKVQLLTSINDINPSECYKELANIQTVITDNEIQDQVTHIIDFISQQELSERLWMSDLGYLWSDTTTTSSSAAGKEFITARLPLVITESSHYHDLIEGVIKTKMQKEVFISTIMETISKDLTGLRTELDTLYKKLNYDQMILKYLEIYRK